MGYFILPMLAHIFTEWGMFLIQLSLKLKAYILSLSMHLLNDAQCPKMQEVTMHHLR